MVDQERDVLQVVVAIAHEYVERQPPVQLQPRRRLRAAKLQRFRQRAQMRGRILECARLVEQLAGVDHMPPLNLAGMPRKSMPSHRYEEEYGESCFNRCHRIV